MQFDVNKFTICGIDTDEHNTAHDLFECDRLKQWLLIASNLHLATNVCWQIFTVGRQMLILVQYSLIMTAVMVTNSINIYNNKCITNSSTTITTTKAWQPTDQNDKIWCKHNTPETNTAESVSTTTCFTYSSTLIKLTLRRSRPNKAGLKCPSVRVYVRMSTVSSILMDEWLVRV